MPFKSTGSQNSNVSQEQRLGFLNFGVLGVEMNTHLRGEIKSDEYEVVLQGEEGKHTYLEIIEDGIQDFGFVF